MSNIKIEPKEVGPGECLSPIRCPNGCDEKFIQLGLEHVTKLNFNTGNLDTLIVCTKCNKTAQARFQVQFYNWNKVD